MKQFAQPGIAIGVVAALQHPVYGVVEILARGFQMPGLEILLAGGEFFLDLLDQVVLAVRNGSQQPAVVAVRRIHYRQNGQFRPVPPRRPPPQPPAPPPPGPFLSPHPPPLPPPDPPPT